MKRYNMNIYFLLCKSHKFLNGIYNSHIESFILSGWTCAASIEISPRILPIVTFDFPFLSSAVNYAIRSQPALALSSFHSISLSIILNFYYFFFPIFTVDILFFHSCQRRLFFSSSSSSYLIFLFPRCFLVFFIQPKININFDLLWRRLFFLCENISLLFIFLSEENRNFLFLLNFHRKHFFTFLKYYTDKVI